jgi:uncharacterized protein (DUF362 family)
MSATSARAVVAIADVAPGYPALAPFHPSEPYPEYGSRPLGDTPNPVYGAVRQLFHDLGYDRGNWGRPSWNPLAGIIRPGDRVFIKPNLVTHEFRRSCGRDGDLFSLITHPSVVRAVADYAALALGGKGEIVIGDNPSVDARFDAILAATRLDLLPDLYREHFATRCRVLDLRPVMTRDLADYGYRSRTTPLSGDPEGSAVLNLGRKSCFYGLNPFLYRGVFTNRLETIRHHWGATQEYSISNSILNADVFISIPKLKAHHKVGATLNLKGLVGIASNKNYLVHWRIGYPGSGGDEFPRAHSRADYVRLAARHLACDLLPESWHLALRRRLKGTVVDRALETRKLSSYENYRGAWDGNDTTWRMTADLYNLFVRDAADWRRRRGREIRFLSVIDGVIAGEGDGPFCPLSKPAGVLLAGEDLLLTDCVAVRLMDYDIDQIRYLRHLLRSEMIKRWPLEVVRDGVAECAESFFDKDRRYLRFVPPSGWPHLAMHEEGER